MRRTAALAFIIGLSLVAGVPKLSADGERDTAAYAVKAAALAAQEADGLAEVADWCRQKGLSEQARDLAAHALTIQPGHALASAVLEELRGDSTSPKSSPVELALVDGSHVRGSAELNQVSLSTEFGLLRFPIRQVQLVVFDFANGKDLVIADGLTMIGKAGVGIFPMDTKVGRVSVNETSLKQLRVVHPCQACGGKARAVCTNCQSKGTVEVKKTCPTCGGIDSKKPCVTCDGKGTVTCPDCNGQGRWDVRTGGMRRTIFCPRCKGKGEIPCPDCKGKSFTACATCKGLGYILETATCPDCRGVKWVPCPTCGGTGDQEPPKPVWPIPPEGTTEPAPTAPAPTPPLVNP